MCKCAHLCTFMPNGVMNAFCKLVACATAWPLLFVQSELPFPIQQKNKAAFVGSLIV